ncbi:MAG: PQQ-binding-like beta-propeller repeat protein [Sedimentisphaerales bacterium]|nr:PQQ-binding-like beta-propeller repeat protein [Sedimentisphaerales bacterium]
MNKLQSNKTLLLILVSAFTSFASANGNWTQFKFDSRHSGNAESHTVTTPLTLMGALPLTDAVFTAPVVADNKVYVLDGSGVLFCIDSETLKVVWKYATPGGKANCNNVSSPAISGKFIHFGTMTGNYFVLDRTNGKLVKKIACGDPIFSTPVVGKDRVYFATLGSKIHALTFVGDICWVWDFLAKWDFNQNRPPFTGNRWSGQDWLAYTNGKRVTWQEQFCCSRNLALDGKMLVVPAGGSLLWLEDTGKNAEFRGVYLAERESPATLGLSIADDGTVYRQWTRRDNGGWVDKLKLVDGKVQADWVRGTDTSWDKPGLISFCSVSIRGRDVFRCRPQENFGFCKHSPDNETQYLGGYPSIASPILLRNNAVYGGLDGSLYVVPLSGKGPVWSFKTAFGNPISAPAAANNGKIYFGCEDGYLYILGPNGNAKLPKKNLDIHKIRSPLKSKLADSKFDWFTNFGNFANTNMNQQNIKPPFKLKWLRRFEGTVKHFSTCGGGRMYTHTAEGQIFAVEQETGRQLWKRYYPGVHVSFTSPLYYQGRIYIPQAGLKQCRLRCLNAATGDLIWETDFSGSPSWNRQLPPIIYKNLIIYQFSTGKYKPDTWLFEHQNTPGFPEDQKPLVRAWNKDTGKEVWTKDFSEFGFGGDDAGLCLMNDTLYYSCFFGQKKIAGITAAMNPQTGQTLWLNTDYAVHSGCTVSGQDGRIYLGGYAATEGTTKENKVNRVYCLNANDGSLLWKSEPLRRAIHVLTIGQKFLFTHAQYYNGYLLDKENGKILTTLTKGYRCTRFTLSDSYLLGPNLDIIDLSDSENLISTGPAIDVLLCVGSFVSNGRIFYTDNGGGLQASQLCGNEAATLIPPWQNNN